MDLLLLAPYDNNNPLPTLFEVFALDELQTVLRNGLSVGIFHLVDRAIVSLSPSFAHLQPFLPEIELVASLLIEGQFLNRFDATTTQRLFNLKLSRAVPRSPVISLSNNNNSASNSNSNSTTSSSLPAATSAGAASAASVHHQIDPRLPQSLSGISFAPLRKRQRFVMLLEAALAPYLIRRLDQLHADWTDDTPEGRERRQQHERNMNPLQLRLFNSLAGVYPILKAVLGIAKVAVWFAYMANKIPYPSLAMAASKVILTRRTMGDEALQKMSPASNRLFMLLSLAITWTIVGFEVADWWQRDGGKSSVLRERKGLPPPPATIKNENNAVEAGKCPICGNAVVNPCVNIASGYVCCYPCLAQHVRDHGTCPVKTHIRVTPRHIRRLFIE